MQRYILRFRGSGSMPLVDVERIKCHDDLTVLDESARSLLVEGREEGLHELIDHMPGWIIAQEQLLPLPDARPRLRDGARRSIAPAASPPPAAAPAPAKRKRAKRND